MMSNDQAKGLRDLVKKNKGSTIETDKAMDREFIPPYHIFLSVVGGMGTTTLISNIANVLSKEGKKVLVIDFNSNFLTTDVFFNILPNYSLERLTSLEKDEKEMLIRVKENVYSIYANKILDADIKEREIFKKKLSNILDRFDAVFIDICGVEKLYALDFILKESKVIVTTTPNPEGIKSAYYGIKYLSNNMGLEDVGIVINKSEKKEVSDKFFDNLSSTISDFLKIEIENFGYISRRTEIMDSARKQNLFTDIYPDSICTEEIKKIKDKIST